MTIASVAATETLRQRDYGIRDIRGGMWPSGAQRTAGFSLAENTLNKFTHSKRSSSSQRVVAAHLVQNSRVSTSRF